MSASVLVGESGAARPVPSGLGAQRKTTHALVVGELRSMILSGALQPGDRLRIEDLAQQFGVSPMPVREALHQLAAEGTAVLDPYRGFSIAELSPDEAEDLYATRAPLEELATRIAVPRLTPAILDQLRDAVARQSRACDDGDAGRFIEADLGFHRILYAASGRTILARQIGGLINSSVRYSRANLPLAGALRTAMEAHQTILDACERGDAALAARVTRRHTEQAAERVIEALTAAGVGRAASALA